MSSKKQQLLSILKPEKTYFSSSNYMNSPSADKVPMPNFDEDDFFDDKTNYAHVNISMETRENELLRNIIYTDDKMQIILQTLNPQETIDYEVHKDASQFVRCESGDGMITIINNNKEKVDYHIYDDISFVIPFNTKHKIKNVSFTEKLKFYTIYSKPVH